MSRDPNDKVPITLRVPEWLRHRMEDRAKLGQRSLNSQVIADLEAMVSQSDQIRARFGTEDIASFMQALSSCFVLAELQTGKSFKSDADTMDRAIIAVQAVLNAFGRNASHAPPSEDATKTVSDAMDIAQFAGMRFFAGKDVPDPGWLRASLEKLRQPAAPEGDQK